VHAVYAQQKKRRKKTRTVPEKTLSAVVFQTKKPTIHTIPPILSDIVLISSALFCRFIQLSAKFAF